MIPRRLGALLPIGMDVAHHIVTHQTLPLLGHGVIDVVLMRFQLCDLLLCDLQPQLPPALANAIHSRRQVRNLKFSEKICCISALAYRVDRGEI